MSIDRNRIEFFRHAAALLPKADDPSPGTAIFWRGADGKIERKCTCSASKRATCRHIKELSRYYKTLEMSQGEIAEARRMKSSLLYRALSLLLESHAVPVDEVTVHLSKQNTPIIKDKQGAVLIEYQRNGPDAARFADRVMRDKNAVAVSRAGILNELIRLTRTPIEWNMVENNARTRRQAAEESIWFRLVCHFYRELGDDVSFLLSPTVEKQSGAFMLSCRTADGEDLCRISVPPLLVERFLFSLAEILPENKSIPIHPIPLQSIFRVSPSTQIDVVEIEPALRFLSESGEERFFERADLERFRYGNLQYIPEIDLLVRMPLEKDKGKKFVAPVKMKLAESQLSSFMSDVYAEKDGESAIVGLSIIERFDSVVLSSPTLDRDWCWLDIDYAVGDSFVSLKDIFKAQKSAERFIRTEKGWIDTAAKEIACVLRRFSPEDSGAQNALKLSRLELLRLGVELDSPVSIRKTNEADNALERIWNFKPATDLAPLAGLKSTLRDYQKKGVEWLLFLNDNGLGGLLCDDMGLGKTHQIMALMLALREQRAEKRPFLVICPATVISHWRRLLGQFAPTLKVSVYYGPGRDLASALTADTLLTTYGVLRNDVEMLQNTDFALAAFDEAHVAKNRMTVAFDAASKLRASLKIGITGTPVENHPSELWSLMELVMPGSLGSFEGFSKRYTSPNAADLEDLSRRIHPFTLRRLKESVLKELPPKIEDIRTCRLSDEQVALYRGVVSTKGADLISELQDMDIKIPYLHIFKILGLLKQICDHPALVNGDTPPGGNRSGKMDLLLELLDESLDSGHKVVIYSQYVRMIELISSTLCEKSVGHAVLTGKTRNRGAVIDRFNNDDSCRVFIGSLIAGGVGIDLTAASVVIHYDRWWNAAKEDQATDRVHRIGQNRSVHVLKLVTEGTLEEKISALIEKKRSLMEQIIKEDDPFILKSFDREDLKALLALPD